jgi:hypothetical protein
LQQANSNQNGTLCIQWLERAIWLWGKAGELVADVISDKDDITQAETFTGSER